MIIAITTRITENSTYIERRSSLSEEWAMLLNQLFPEAIILPILNNDQNILASLDKIGVTHIIISNGNDIGEYPYKDDLEFSLIEYSIKNNIPLLGTCRGFQIINNFFGSAISPNIELESGESHVPNEHVINFKSKERIVNSFHNQGILMKHISDEFDVIGYSKSNVAEAVKHKSFPILGLQWHPERAHSSSEQDKETIRLFFEGSF